MATAAGTSADLSRDLIEKGGVSAQQLVVVGLCMLFNLLDGFDITAMAVVASAVATDLQLTADRLGWIFSFALAGMMAGAMFLAPLSDVIGRRRMIISAIGLVGVSIILTATATTLFELIALRFISGLGAGAMLACQAALASEYSQDRLKALSVAAVTSGYPLGAMSTAMIAAYIMPDYGWRGMFWFGGGVTFLLAIIAWLYIPESLQYLFQRRPSGVLDSVNRILRRLGKEPLGVMPTVVHARAEQPGFVAGMLRMLQSDQIKTTLTLWAAFLLCFSTLYFLMSWIPKLMEDSGYGSAAGRDAYFLFNLGGVIGIYLMGWLSTRVKLTNVICYLSLAAAASMAVFALATAPLNVRLGLIFATGILQQGGFTGLYAAAAKAYPTQIRSTGIGWAIGLGRFGAVVGPAVAGYLIAAGLDMSANYLVFAVPMALGGIIAYRLHIR